MRKLGLKLYSVNDNYIEQAIKLYQETKFQFIELYIVPGSYEQYGTLWKDLYKKYKIHFVLHAAHFMAGVDLGDVRKFDENKKVYQEVSKFADDLDVDCIIFHPGVESSIKEVVRQLLCFDDKRILIENKPYYTITKPKKVCNAYSPEDIAYIIKNAKVGFCLDLSHCVCAANSLSVDAFEYWDKFLKLDPQMAHFVDNDFDSEIDQHKHFGDGSYDLKTFLNVLPKDVPITIETYKDSKINLDDFIHDANYLYDLEKTK